MIIPAMINEFRKHVNPSLQELANKILPCELIVYYTFILY